MNHPPSRILLDTDMLTDCDDAGALAMLHALADLGEAEILGVALNGIDSHGLHSAVVSAINTYFGRPDLPIGVSPRSAEQTPTKPSSYSTAIFEDYPHDGLRDAERPDAVALYRRLLAEADDASVTIVSIGFLSNIADLLAQTGGRDLVAKKVRAITIMGGAYPSGREYNFEFQQTGSTTQACLEAWPDSVPITFIGYELGEQIITGKSYAHCPDSPMRRAYQLAYDSINRGRPSWDQVAVFHGVRGCQHQGRDLLRAVNGRNHISEDGLNTWEMDAAAPHAYLELNSPPEDLASAIEALMIAEPKAKH